MLLYLFCPGIRAPNKHCCACRQSYCERPPFMHPFFFFVRAEEFHGIPEKNAERTAQVGISQHSFFVQTIFHCSTSLHRPLVYNPTFCCPGIEALGIIVVSLPFTAYHWGSLFVFYYNNFYPLLEHPDFSGT